MNFIPVARVLIKGMYLFFTVAALVFIFVSSQVISENLGFFQIVLWHLFLLVGSVVGLLAKWRRKPMIEVSGLLMTATAFVAYGITLIYTYNETGATNSRLGLGIVFVGVALGLLGRAAETLVNIFAIEHVTSNESGE